MNSYSNLSVCVLTEEQHERTCNYWFTVTDHATPHTAFTTKRGFMRWLNERGLSLSQPLTDPGTWSYQKIIGSYNTVSHMSTDEFEALTPIIVTRTPSNGDYVVAKITEENGVRTVHTLNPNVKRKVYNYFTSKKMMS